MENTDFRRLAPLVVGLGLVILGALFLVGAIFRINVWGFLWPFFIIVPGLLFFAGMVGLGKSGAPLAVPGSIVTMVGLLLFYQSLTGHWESWAYAWALIFPTAVGTGLAITGMWANEPQTTKVGAVMATVGLGVFLFFAFFFELLLNISGVRTGALGRLMFPALLIGGGLALLLFALLPRRR
jgi:hypothetical protein